LVPACELAGLLAANHHYERAERAIEDALQVLRASVNQIENFDNFATYL
jgi:hypothetical protein